MAKQNDKAQVVPVDKYEERPDASRTVEENVLAEGRALRTDQIPDYHQKNPTLDAKSIPSQDEITEAVQGEAIKAAKKATTKDAMAEAVEDATL